MNIKILSVVTGCLAWGCSDFLEEKSQSEVRPSTVTDIEKILEGDAYLNEADGALFADETYYFTDNIKCDNQTNAVEDRKKEKRRWYFTWNLDMFNEAGGGEDITYWTIPYSRIKGCNIVLDYIDGMDGNEKKREYLRGEAYTLRGFYYMTLVNFFGKPYNVEDPTKNPGIPLKLISGVSDELFTRNMVSEVYDRVEKDLLAGVRLMRENDINLASEYRLKPVAGNALLSRMYLYMADWDNVIVYADSVLQEKPELQSLSENVKVCAPTSKELLWMIPARFDNYSSHVMAFTVSVDLVNMYGQDVDNRVNDIRGDYMGAEGRAYLVKGSSWQFPELGTWVSHTDKAFGNNAPGIRTSEVYLNRAEAYCQKYIGSGDRKFGELALADLNEVRRHRFANGYVDKNMDAFANAEELLAFCLRERRRELCGESNHRWFDLRRTGMPAIEHVFFYPKEEGVSHKLQDNDPRYVLPIPEQVIRRNRNLNQNQY